MDDEQFHLTRFIEAQATSYASALQEIRSGKKRTHWIWYVFPQLRGLGTSFMAETYGLSGLAEAQLYLAHPLLGPRLRESTDAMLGHQTAGAVAVLGELDAAKFRSCLTLFHCADPTAKVFTTTLERFFRGELDPRTLDLLASRLGEK